MAAVLLVLSATDFLHDAPYLAHFDAKIARRGGVSFVMRRILRLLTRNFGFLLKFPKLSVLRQLYTALCTVSEVYAIFFSCARTIFKKKIYLCSLKHYVNI